MKKQHVVAALAGASLSAALVLGGCAAPKAADQATETKTESTPAATQQASTQGQQNITLHRGYAAAHGDKCFTEVVVATAEDGTILSAYLNDYQFTAPSADYTPVPNSDKGFAEGMVSGQELVDKAGNSKAYSAHMAEKGGSTQEWAVSIKAIEDFAKGKKPTDLTSVSGVDAVSGATLVDTPGYLKAIADTATSDAIVTKAAFDGDTSKLELKHALAAAHGEKAFASAVVLTDGSKVVAASIDEFQFSAKDGGYEGVPNSDKAFGENYADGKVLISKSVNSETYSKGMAEKGGSTQPWIKSIDAIETFVQGKTASDLGSVSGADAVSGATLVDTAGYVKAVADALK